MKTNILFMILLLCGVLIGYLIGIDKPNNNNKPNAVVSHIEGPTTELEKMGAVKLKGIKQ